MPSVLVPFCKLAADRSQHTKGAELTVCQEAAWMSDDLNEKVCAPDGHANLEQAHQGSCHHTEHRSMEMPVAPYDYARYRLFVVDNICKVIARQTL